MIFKIIGVPDGAVEIMFASGRRELMEKSVSVYDLPNAPKKRVIELPKDLLEKLTTEKENASNIFVFFGMENVAEIMDWLSEYLPIPYNLEPENIAADWYLGHVEFMAMKESHFVLAFPNKVTSSLDTRYLQLISNGYAINNIDVATKLTDADIDGLAKKFPEINFDALEKVEVDD
jgi:hypothetical protein